MKKALSLLLALVLCLSLCACGSKGETVEITLDNWQTYFEYRHDIEWSYNDFDEPIGATYITYLCVKDEYADRINLEQSNVIWEYNESHRAVTYEMDLDTKTLTITGAPVGSIQNDIIDIDRITTGTAELLKSYSEDCPEELHACSYGTGWDFFPESNQIDEENNNVRYIVEYEITRIQGTICLQG